VVIAAGKLRADPRQLGLDGPRFDDLDHRAPAGEVPGDVQGSRCGEADPGTPVVGGNHVMAVKCRAIQMITVGKCYCDRRRGRCHP
jgi:hypothetical protein